MSKKKGKHRDLRQKQSPPAPRKWKHSPLVSRCRYSTAVTFWITSSASVTADGMSHRSALPVWQSLRAAVHHSSPIYVKRNILASTFIPHPWLSQQDFSRFVLDFLVFGNAFLEKRYSTTGKVIRLETSPAKYTRRGVEEDVYWWVPSFNEPTAFATGSVFHLLEPDINQELYGLPEYLSALNSAG